jgi:hypothetical protein
MFASSVSVPSFAVYKRLTPEFMAASTAKLAKSKSVQSEVEYFKNKVSRLQEVDDVFKDSRLMRFILQSYDLADQIQYPARIKQIMKDDPAASGTLLQRMTSPGYRDINAAMDFFKSGLTKLKSEALQADIIARYQSARNVDQVSQLSPNLEDALYFERKIGKVKNGYEILGDRALFNVARSALNLPPYVSAGNIERLKIMIESKLDMGKLNDSKYVKGLIERFLVLKDIETRQSEGGGLINMFA